MNSGRKGAAVNIPVESCKLCTGCGQLRPIDEFRLRRKGGTARECRCRCCHAADQRAYRRRRRDKALANFSQQAKWRSDAAFLAALSRGMVSRFGGMEKFVDEFVTFVHRTSHTKVAANCYLAILRLMQVAERAER